MSDSPAWVSVRGVAWVIDDAPVPADLIPVLLVVARRADAHGRGSYQSVATIAAKTGKSEAQVARDIRRLLDLGLIMLGDQTLPERHGVPTGRRPVVYDVALHVVGPKPRKGSKNPTGRKKPATPEPPARPEPQPEPEPEPGVGAAGVGEKPPGVTPGMDATPPTAGDPQHGCGPTPGMDAGGASRMDATPPPRMDAPQTRQINPEKNPSNPPARAGEAALVREHTDIGPDEIDGFLDWLTGRYRLRSPVAYLAALAERGHLQDRVAEWRLTCTPTSNGLADRTAEEAITAAQPDHPPAARRRPALEDAPPSDVPGDVGGPVDVAALLAQVRAIQVRKRAEYDRQRQARFPGTGRAA